MKLVLSVFLIGCTLVTFYFCSYSVLHGEIHFFNDVGRDFLLLREIDEKKIVLIGPRSNASGLFHGPLWSYINYPIYRLGKGDPVTVGWYWLFLGLISLGIGFYGAKKLFGTLAGLTYIFLYATHLMTHINGMFHSEAPVLLTPLFFFSIVLYEKYKRVSYLLVHFIILAMIIQLNFGVGTPLFILSMFLTVYLIRKKKSWKHLCVFLLIPFLLSNFIIFDLRHDHVLLKSAYAAWELTKTWHPLPLDFWVWNRIEETVNLHVIQTKNILSWFIFGIVLLSTWKEIKMRGKYRMIYLLLIYYYFGYMLLSFLNKGVILVHFVYLLGPLTTLWFASFLRGNYRFVFLPLLGVIAYIHIQYGYTYIHTLQNEFIEKHPTSWRAMRLVAQTIVTKQENNPFGYFVFAPDAFAYGPRYAMMYHFHRKGAAAFEYTKKQTTYIVAEPPPPNDPYMTHIWWRKNAVAITTEPIWTQTFPSGYVIEEFHLREDEQRIPHDKTIELGIHFR